MNICDCSCHIVPYEVCVTDENDCCCQDTCENINMDDEIAKLKSDLFERQQNERDYCALESKFRQLQNDLQLLSEEKLRLEYELRKTENETNKSIPNFQCENLNLKKEIEEKNVLNKKLYNDNNNLFHALEGKTCDNQCLKSQICQQEETLKKLNLDKCNLQNAISNLNQLKDKHISDIQNLNNQINMFNKQNNDLDNNISNKTSINMQIVSEINNEKNINSNLANELRNKENALNQITQELFLANETLKRLDNDVNSLNLMNNKNKEEIACFNNNLLKETACKNQVLNDNQKLEDIIHQREIQIQNITDDNNMNKVNNNNLNGDINLLNNQIEAYKKHILVLTDSNEQLSIELEAILGRDSQLMYALDRVGHLRDVERENENVINASLDHIKMHMRNNGNRGFVVQRNCCDNNIVIGNNCTFGQPGIMGKTGGVLAQ